MAKDLLPFSTILLLLLGVTQSALASRMDVLLLAEAFPGTEDTEFVGTLKNTLES